MTTPTADCDTTARAIETGAQVILSTGASRERLAVDLVTALSVSKAHDVIDERRAAAASDYFDDTGWGQLA